MRSVVHLVSSMRRGGRERQLAGILASKSSEVSNRAIVFNKGTQGYVDEYKLQDKVIYLTSHKLNKRLFEIYRIVKENKPDIIWSWGGFEATFSIIVSFLSGVKHVNGSVRHGIVLNTRKHRWRKFLLHRSKYVVGNSLAGLKANGIKSGKVLYNGLDEKFFLTTNINRDVILSDLNIKQAHGFSIIVSVANLVPFKDYTTVLKALSSLKTEGFKFNYLIIGEGPERSKIEQLVADMQLDEMVYLLGRRENVNQILGVADLFVHSSKGEGCSNAILEAMAAGLPIVASDTGGTSEIVKSAFGLLFDFGNSEQLKDHLRALLDNPELIAQMKQQSREYAKSNFSMERMLGDYQHIVKTIIQS